MLQKIGTRSYCYYLNRNTIKKKNLTVLGETRGGTKGGAPSNAKFLPHAGSERTWIRFKNELSILEFEQREAQNT